jgi:hypothetical protein
MTSFKVAIKTLYPRGYIEYHQIMKAYVGLKVRLYKNITVCLEGIHPDHDGVDFLFPMALPAHSGPRPLIQFSNYFLQRVELLG